MPLVKTITDTYTVTHACNTELKTFNNKKTRAMYLRLHCKKCAICSNSLKFETLKAIHTNMYMHKIRIIR